LRLCASWLHLHRYEFLSLPFNDLWCCALWVVYFGRVRGGGKSPTPVTLQSISVSAASAKIVAGLKQQLSATGNYSDGTSRAVTGAMWSTSDGTVATVDSTGLVTALKQGAVTISATSGTATGNALLTVDPPNLLSVNVSPQNPTLVTGQTQQFTARGS